MEPDDRIVGAFENSEDEKEILTNQDETDPGTIGIDEGLMGAGPTELVPEQAEAFIEGQVDVVDQMRRQAQKTLRQTHRD